MVPPYYYISDYGGTPDLMLHQLRRSWEICMHIEKERYAGYVDMSIHNWITGAINC